MSAGPIITLSHDEAAIAQYLGRRRHEANVRLGNVNMKLNPAVDPIENNVTGVMSELAFAKHANVYPDLTVVDSGPMPKFDFRTHRGDFGDVKGTPYERGKLVMLPYAMARTPPQLVLVLMVGADRSYRYAGYARAADLGLSENLTDLGRGPTYALEQSALEKTLPP